MSGREKFLITLLAAVAILLGGFKLLIEPQMKKLAEANNRLAEAQAQQQELISNRNSAQTLEAANKDLRRQIGDESAQLFPTLSSDMIHIYFEDLAGAAGIQFRSLTMSEISFTQVMIPGKAAPGTGYPMKDAVDYLNGNTSGTPEKSGSGDQKNSPPDTLEVMTVTLQFQSDYARTRDFLNRIKSGKRTAVVGGVNMSVGNDGAFSVNMTVHCYGAVKLEKDSISENRLPDGTGKANPFQ